MNDKMQKPQIIFREEPVRFVCNAAFYTVKNILPQSIRVSEKYDKALAFFLGTASGFGAAELGKYLVYPNVVEPLANALANSVSLENVVSHCLAFTIGEQ